MTRPSVALALLVVLLAGCQAESRAPDASPADPSSGAGLERAAIETGVIADAARTSPVGLYRRSHEGGQDTLCVAPDERGGLRFGTQVSFGTDGGCRGEGSARRAGDKLILRFRRGGRCIVVARYDGDKVAMPGVVDSQCADLCVGRGSLEGVSFPRISSEAAAALRARDRDGEALCGI
ncbi:MAG: hypothetical protein ABW164_06125 [Sphingobium sp.]